MALPEIPVCDGHSVEMFASVRDRGWFAVHKTHPGLFGVTMVEFWVHLIVGIAYIAFGRHYGKSSATAITNTIYSPLAHYFPDGLPGWGAFHIGVALVMGWAMVVNHWETVRKCLAASFVAYNAQMMAFGIGCANAWQQTTTSKVATTHGVPDLVRLSYLQVIVFGIGLSAFSWYAYHERTVNPAMAVERRRENLPVEVDRRHRTE